MMIGDFKYIDDRQGDLEGTISKNSADIELLQSEKAVSKIRKIFSKIPYSFNFYFLDCSLKPYNYYEIGPYPPILITDYKTAVNELPILGLYLKDQSDTINIVYKCNQTDQYSSYIPFTSWILIHRMMHIFQVTSHSNIEGYSMTTSCRGTDIYDVILGSNSMIDRIFTMVAKYIGYQFRNSLKCGYSWKKNMSEELIAKIFTMRSARTGNLWFDLDCIAELFAQYVITGKITFNKFPDKFGVFKLTQSRRYILDDMFDMLAEDLEKSFKQLLELSKGRVFIL